MVMRTKQLRVPTPSMSGDSQQLRYIFYTDWGDECNPNVLLCVHGLTRNCRDFDDLAMSLESRYRVISVDVVGRGHSDWLDNPADYDHYPLYISDAVSLVTHIQSQYTKRITLDWVGISMGGLIGMVLAAQPDIPFSIHKLIMSDIGPFIPASALLRMSDYVGKDLRFDNFDEFEAYIKKISASFGPLTDKQWRHLAIHSVREYADGTVGFRYDPGISSSLDKREIEDIDLWAQWDVLNIPTLVMHGMESDVLLPEIVVKMQKRGAKADIAELPGVGHAPVLMANHEISIVSDYLRS